MAKAPGLSALAGRVWKETGAEAGLYSAYRRKTTTLPDMNKKEKQNNSGWVLH